MKWSSCIHSSRSRASATLVRVDRRRRLVELCDDVADALPHRRPVLDRRTHVAEHAAETGAEPLQLLRAGLAVDLDVDQRLGLPVLGADLEQPALRRPGACA